MLTIRRRHAGKVWRAEHHRYRATREGIFLAGVISSIRNRGRTQS